MQDLHQLPKLSDSISYLYVEHCIIEQKALAVEKIDKHGRTMIPAANLTVLMLGPGTSITHAAIKSLADNGCGIVWVGEEATHFYAHGQGETRRAYHILEQARLASNPDLRLAVCKRMYQKRFLSEVLDEHLTIVQLRGKEGARVRVAYEKAGILNNVTWTGRNYDRKNWNRSDPINRALSAANALLYGVCHSAIVSGGYSPALGFIHTGKQRSFVYDIADLYKVDLVIPVAFRVVGESPYRLDQRVRKACREAFREYGLLKRILPDIEDVLGLSKETITAGENTDVDAALPEPLWTPDNEEDNDLLEDTYSGYGSGRSQTNEPAVQVESTNISVPNMRTIPFSRNEKDPIQLRKERAEAGLKGRWQVEPLTETSWSVITGSGPPGYVVFQYGERYVCGCLDYDKNELEVCKHTFAVQLKYKREN